MRSSQSILQKSRSLLKHCPSSPAFSLISHLHQPRPRLSPAVLTRTRFLSTTPLSPNELLEHALESEKSAVESTVEEQNDASEEPLAEEPDKANIKYKRSRSTAKEPDIPYFPDGLDIIWVPKESLLDSESDRSFLPPPEIFEEALDNLLITLHPQNQHRAAYATGVSSRPVEPTLGLYCPIEGGEYVIDATVRELAFRTGAEILVVDSIHLAAGEWGQFGEVAGCLNLPRNPLHFSNPVPPPAESPSAREQRMMEEDGDSDFPSFLSQPSGLTITGLKPPMMGNRPIVTPSSRRSIPPSKLEVFFGSLVNLPVETLEESPSGKFRPRLIYVRDFPTLSASSSLWYPALLNAVRQRRRGPLSRTSGGIAAPVTIIFGMTPPLAASSDISSGSTSLLSLLMNRTAQASQVAFGGKPEHNYDFSESEAAELAREKRLKLRLKKWEKSPTGLQGEFPKLPTEEENGGGGGGMKPEIIVVGPGGSSSPMLNFPLSLGEHDQEGETQSQFFRSSVLVPSTRSIPQERLTRIARRHEINELTIRMGVGAVGGCIDSTPASSAIEQASEDAGQDASSSTMWGNWGHQIEIWSNVRKIADRAMGSMLVDAQPSTSQNPSTLEPTPVPWSAVESAWKSYSTIKNTRKSWLKQVGSSTASALKDGEDTREAVGSQQELDKVIESVKHDPELDQHEQRLLPCIVNSASMHTSFSQVHLPDHTIDSVRTIVSLPLIHPHAFRQGILKEHSMTGCLLFGPPGTGKTLVVRALAKEAGCRMLAISPSDVMDMYVGEGEKLVKAVFSLARRLSPCVVFLDEIDALFGARMSSRESGSAHAHRGVITEFMQEMDGLKSSKDDNVIVIGATNRPFDLDDAVLRRLPRRLLVDLPRESDRQEILKILLRDESLSQDVSIESIARRTEGFSGSDLKHLCVSAALDAVKENLELPWASRRPAQPSSSASDTPAPLEAPSSSESPSEEASSPEAASVDLQVDAAAILESQSDKIEPIPHIPRVLQLRNFEQALKEITPSSSESLGSLADLRKWNDEFGEGRKDRRKKQVWGKGRFGFIRSDLDGVEEGRVAQTSPESS